MSIHHQTAQQFASMLTNCLKFIDKAEELAKAKKFDAQVFLNQRLAPDMYSFTKQIQVATDNAKNGIARLAGKEPPKYEDNEKTVEELRERLKKTIAYLNTFKADDFRGADDRRVTLPWAPTKHMIGAEYLTQLLLPNFYFHAMAAYAILRNSGVDVGKTDFIGNINMRD
jgi:hypothetical protein